MTKEREEEDLESTEGTPEDDQPEVLVKDSGGGEQVVEVARESRKERRQREQADITRKIIEEAQKPLLDQLAMLARQQPVVQQFVQPPAAIPTGGSDPEWRKLVQEQTRIVSLVRASTDPTEIKRLEDEWHDAEYKKGELIASKTTERAQQKFRRDNPPPEDPVHKIVRSEFQDVLTYGPDATEYASALFKQEKIRAFREKRSFDEMATHRKVLTQTAEEFGLRPKALPVRNPAQQGRFSSLSASSTGSGATGGPPRALTKAEKSMARAFAGPDMPEQKAYESWSKMMGPDYFRDV
jgi:hypothetical protein